jgi:hypothetical protein
VVLALTGGGDGFRWFGNTVKDVSDDIAETLDLLHEATEDIKSASHTIKKTGAKIKVIAEETSEKASGILNSTGEIVKDIKSAVSDREPEEKTEKTLGISNSAGKTASGMKNAVSEAGISNATGETAGGMKNAVPGAGPEEKQQAVKKVKRRAVKHLKKRTATKDDNDTEPQ